MKQKWIVTNTSSISDIEDHEQKVNDFLKGKSIFRTQNWNTAVAVFTVIDYDEENEKPY